MSNAETTPLDVIAPALRGVRERAGISITELAKRAGVAKSTLSQLESGSGNPSVETLWALAVALDVPFSRLVEPPAPQVHVVRSGDAPVLRSEKSPFEAGLLSSCPPGARRDLYVLTLRPGQAREAEPHLAGTTEHLVVTAGRIRVGPATDPVELNAGDYIAFSGAVPHVYEALTHNTSAVLVMEHT